MRRSEIRPFILDTALRLFKQRGYQATGVDLIVEATGLAKTTLYRHFPSKDDLIVAAINHDDERARDAMREFVEGRADKPIDRLLATFDYLKSWIASDEFRGCPFLAAAGEHRDSDGAVFRAAALHKRLVLAYFEELAHAAGMRDAKRIAAEMNLLHEGATAVAQVTRDPRTADQAKRMAARLLATEAAQQKPRGAFHH